MRKSGIGSDGSLIVHQDPYHFKKHEKTGQYTRKTGDTTSQLSAIVPETGELAPGGTKNTKKMYLEAKNKLLRYILL